MAVAEERTSVLIVKGGDAKTKGGDAKTKDAVIGGIATQRALEIETKIGSLRGLPEELPVDDLEARKVVMQAWWLASRSGGQAATRHLAAALGIKSAQQQPVEITFVRPGTTQADS
jgi:hypothetical protein